jgi:hypothetical protein
MRTSMATAEEKNLMGGSRNAGGCGDGNDDGGTGSRDDTNEEERA